METDFGLKVSFQKTKMIVAGQEVIDADTEPMQVGTEEIKCVQQFGSVVASSGRVDVHVEGRIPKASRAIFKGLVLEEPSSKTAALPSRPNG